MKGKEAQVETNHFLENSKEPLIFCTTFEGLKLLICTLSQTSKEPCKWVFWEHERGNTSAYNTGKMIIRKHT